MKSTREGRPFAFKDCALSAIATGRRAQNLRELRDHLLEVNVGSLYYHFWGGRLRPQFDEPEYNNDFAAWARHSLHDHMIAERLAMVDPMDYASLEDLRGEVVEVIEERLAEQEFLPWAKVDEQFSFIRSQIVVFDTHRSIADPAELVREIPHSSTSSIFYHFIDARRRTPDGQDDFSTWLRSFGSVHNDLLAALADVDPYFATLGELRTQLSSVVGAYFPDTTSGGIN
ncbi:MAG: hypothetical protein IH600_00290 [Bacteroidetes bacterium]|nr:hypothetical protein [Bacteroidota bacterium]